MTSSAACCCSAGWPGAPASDLDPVSGGATLGSSAMLASGVVGTISRPPVEEEEEEEEKEEEEKEEKNAGAAAGSWSSPICCWPVWAGSASLAGSGDGTIPGSSAVPAERLGEWTNAAQKNAGAQLRSTEKTRRRRAAMKRGCKTLCCGF